MGFKLQRECVGEGSLGFERKIELTHPMPGSSSVTNLETNSLIAS